jgi:hypothetical protein
MDVAKKICIAFPDRYHCTFPRVSITFIFCHSWHDHVRQLLFIAQSGFAKVYKDCDQLGDFGVAYCVSQNSIYHS